jgi:hypothetical protein
VRRFFTFDTISGLGPRSAKEIAAGTPWIPKIVRYTKSMSLVVNLSNAGNELLEVPYLVVDYRERQVESIVDNSLTEISFSSEYIFGTEGFWQGATMAFWVLFGTMILLLIISTVVLSDRPELATDQNARVSYLVVKSLFVALDLFSYLYFWYIFAMTGYWFVFFKLQERVYCFLPAPDSWEINYLPYEWLFGWVAGAKLLFVLLELPSNRPVGTSSLLTGRDQSTKSIKVLAATIHA